MNENRISQAAANIAKYRAALKWLEEYGIRIDGRNDAARVTVSLVNASACPGAKEAAEILSAYARLSLPDVVHTTIKACQNTIAMEVDAIRQELDSAS